jgi:CheY-like chemotaxis protein
MQRIMGVVSAWSRSIGPTPAIALTACARAGDRVRGIAAGFRAHLSERALPEAGGRHWRPALSEPLTPGGRIDYPFIRIN